MDQAIEASTSGLNRRDLLKTDLLLAGGALLPTVAAAATPAAAHAAPPPNRVSTRRKLGALEVSSIGLGVQNMSRTYQTTAPTRTEMHRIIRTAHEHGVTLFDAAEAYGPFEVERKTGHATGKEPPTHSEKMMKQAGATFLLLLALAMPAAAQKSAIFARGEIATTDNHTGTVWLKELSEADSVFRYSIATATFAPGAKLDWHVHPAGQILLITEGVGYYQERGKPRQTVQKGQVIKCQPGVEHWHGAAPKRSFTYLATTPAQKGKTIWLKRVTDAEYRSGN